MTTGRTVEGRPAQPTQRIPPTSQGSNPMEFTPHQVSCADQLMANARNRLGIVLPRMRTIVEDNGDNPWPELAALAKGTLVAVSNIPDARARTEAVANLATLHT